MKNLTHKIAKYKKPAIWTLISLNLLLATGYTYAVNRTVFNVVATTSAEKALAQSSANEADLESQYITLDNQITLDFAYSMGFQDASGQEIFINKTQSDKALSFNAI